MFEALLLASGLLAQIPIAAPTVGGDLVFTVLGTEDGLSRSLVFAPAEIDGRLGEPLAVGP